MSDNTGNVMTLHIGREELVIQQRYEVLSIANDIFIGLLFLVGSFFFLSSTMQLDGTWLFILGSVMMLIRPVIRLARRIHIRRLQPVVDQSSSMDF
ncbi:MULTISPECIES: YrhK family protein [Kocuria]|uniref:YrhK domain-containing protein n=1 Tax=Kocuria subflava TaxID=1736139 RepID=A0A846TZI8_9MICC|nr:MULTISPECIES: YrhK family protein [Kocuria]NKE10627.1 hypothetical protein [Kocuria subflava]